MRFLITFLVGMLIFSAGCGSKVLVIKTSTSEKKLDSRAVPKKSNEKQSDIFLAKAKKAYHKGKYKQTLKFCDKAIMFDHSNWEAHFYIGLATQRIRLYAESVEALKLGLKLGPKNKVLQSEMHFNLALNYEKMGMAKRAKSEYQLALSLNEANQEARKGLNRIKAKKTMKKWKKDKRH